MQGATLWRQLLAVFIVCRAIGESVDVTLALGGEYELIEASAYTCGDPSWTASAEDDTSVLPAPNGSAVAEVDAVHVTLPPVSWNMLRLRQLR